MKGRCHLNLLALLALVSALAGCSLPAAISQPGTASAPLRNRVESAELHAPPPYPYTYGRRRWKGKGGVISWFQHSQGEYSASFGYAPNSIGKGGVPGLLSSADGLYEGNVPRAPGATYTDWVGFAAFNTLEDFSITFDDANLAFSISGGVIRPGVSFSLYVYTASCIGPCQTWTYVKTISLGSPVNGKLTAPSLFENGYVATQATRTTAFILAEPKETAAPLALP